ncbi:hypothetical protein ACEPAG_3382 [Sanghuangporus baumii]
MGDKSFFGPGLTVDTSQTITVETQFLAAGNTTSGQLSEIRRLNYPTDADPNQPGVARGNCSTSSSVPEDVESQSPNSQVVFSDIKYGPIGSTF